MAEITVEIILSDPERTEEEIIRDFTRFLGARKAFRRLINNAVVARIQGRPRKKS